MAIPYYIFGIIYLLALVIAVLFFLFNLYHLRRFGFFDFTALLVTVVAGSILVIVNVFVIIFLYQVPWLESGEVFERLPFDSLMDKL